jgi:3-deoxy-D-manno-octulosonic-acid transferase
MKLFWLSIYNLILYPAFFIVAVLLCPFNHKIRAGFLGRYYSLKKLKYFKSINSSSDIYWFHVSSFGEFQQIESIISSIKNSNDNVRIIVSFFSPSGYSNVNDDNIDCKIYLPFDFAWSIFRVLKLVKPKKIIFASYDIWPNIVLIARFLNIDTILISARIHNDSFKLGRLGKSIYKAIYSLIGQIFTVNNQDLENIKLIVPDKIIEAMGNPRFDIALRRESNVDVKFDIDYKLKNRLFLFASLWPEDDSILFPRIFDLLKNNHSAKIILIPHELSDRSINYYQKQASRNNLSSIVVEDYIDLSKLKEQIIIINTVGILYKLYWQAHISYIGGGFSKNGIHNIMEPAVASNPIIFGPNYSNGNFSEAEELLSTSAAFTINSDLELIEVFEKLNDISIYDLASTSARNVMENNIGSTSKLLSKILA